jgi:DNA-binding GntR family transcriptional regulator
VFNRCFVTDGHEPEFLFAVHSMHSQFHLRIAEGADCGALLMAFEKNQVLIFNWLFDTAARRPALPPRFHCDLAEAMGQHDPEVADAAMRAHIRHGLDDMVHNLTAQGLAKAIKRVK